MAKAQTLFVTAEHAVPLRGAVLALGNFDGFHLGHQAVVGEAARLARQMGRPMAVAIFAPHPKQYFRPDLPPFELTRVDQRAELFAAAGADATLVLPFDADIAALSADQFLNGWLLGRCEAGGIVTGDNFRFGAGRTGTVDLLTAEASRLGFACSIVERRHGEGGVISSTRIRDAIQRGDCATAAQLLGRPYTLRGTARRVRAPDIVGLPLHHYLRPAPGTYDALCQNDQGDRIRVRARIDAGRESIQFSNQGMSWLTDSPIDVALNERLTHCTAQRPWSGADGVLPARSLRAPHESRRAPTMPLSRGY